MFRWFENLIQATATPSAVQPPNGLRPFIWHFVRQHRGLFAILVALQLVIGLLDAALPLFVGMLVDRLTRQSPSDFISQHWTTLAAMAAVVMVFRPLALVLQYLISWQAVAPGFSNLIRWQSHWHVVRQAWSFFQSDFAGRIANKVMQSGYALRQAVTTSVNIVFYIAIFGTSALVTFLTIDWRLAIPMLVWLTAYGFLLWWFVPPIGDAARGMSEARSMVTGRIVDSYTNIVTVKLFARAADEDAFVRTGVDQYVERVRSQNRLITKFTAALVFLNGALVGTTAAVSIWLWSEGAITVGSVATALPFVLQLVGMAGWLAWELMEVFENLGVTQESMETIARPITVQDKPGAFELPPVSGAIMFDDVRFGYGRDLPVLKGVTLAIRPGEKIGLVGRSGAGKSTLVNLLLRFHDVEGGRILVDGADISEATQESLRANIAMVTQDTSLLHRSIRDNIRYGRMKAPDAEIAAAAERSQADGFIKSLEDWKGRRGYDAHVGERGVKLSGGQRQRIAIARVILKDAPILILDEATSSLDSEVEAAIQENLTDLMRGKTVIAIAHRLSTLQIMDRLVVLDNGSIAEQGTHAELLANGGLYADLWARQSGGFIIKPRMLEPREAAE